MSKYVALNDIYLVVLTVYLQNNYMIAPQNYGISLMMINDCHRVTSYCMTKALFYTLVVFLEKWE